MTPMTIHDEKALRALADDLDGHATCVGSEVVRDDLVLAAAHFRALADRASAVAGEEREALISAIRDHMVKWADWKPEDSAYPDIADMMFAVSAPFREAAISRAREEMRERCAKVCRDKAVEFLSEEYATDQPMSSFSERFACEQCSEAIRALAPAPTTPGDVDAAFAAGQAEMRERAAKAVEEVSDGMTYEGERHSEDAYRANSAANKRTGVVDATWSAARRIRSLPLAPAPTTPGDVDAAFAAGQAEMRERAKAECDDEASQWREVEASSARNAAARIAALPLSPEPAAQGDVETAVLKEREACLQCALRADEQDEMNNGAAASGGAALAADAIRARTPPTSDPRAKEPDHADG